MKGKCSRQRIASRRSMRGLEKNLLHEDGGWDDQV